MLQSDSFAGMTPIKDDDADDKSLGVDDDDERGEDSSTANVDHSSVKDSGSMSGSATNSSADAKRIWCFKVIVILVLMGTAAIMATMTYRTVSNNEMNDFKAEFKATANQIVQMANKNVNNIFLSVKTLSTMFPSAAHQLNASLPYITVADFEAIGTSVRKVAKASVLAYAPVLRTEQDLHDWSMYSSNNTQWIEQGRTVVAQMARAEAMKNGSTSSGGHTHDGSAGHSHVRFLSTMTSSETEHDISIEPHPGITNFVYSLNNVTGAVVRESGYGLFAPFWQMTPVPNDTTVVNFNLASTPIFGRLLRRVLKSRQVVLSELLDANELRSWTTDGANGDTNSPASVVAQPVFDALVPTHDDIVMGTVLALIPWKDFFDDVLPKGHLGVHVVADSCGTNNTFRIDGAEAEYIGKGDHHDRKYNDFEVLFEFEIDVGVGHDSANCHQHIYIFPTDEFKKHFITYAPVMYAAGILAMFSFAVVVFLLYDWLVANRQHKTESKANQTNAIVQNLFPGNVAAQLFGPANTEAENLLSGPGVTGSSSPHVATIAELYPSATVLFADIEGFTAWSSMRDPHQVFTLLETIFQAFDSIAKKRGVYKVETVGDCYVAVCGVPKRSEDHAVQMARFAVLANAKFSEIVHRLELTLGPDTGDLGMRFGMHSGPITAGVLRGDRARFQLFGDTVNTASRIESAGRRGCVHVSEQTAAELIKCGKEEWLVRRDDQIEAKGKGKLVTYWLKLTIDRRPTRSVGNESTNLDSEASELPASKTNRADSEAGVSKVQSTNTATKLSKVKHDRLIEWNTELLVQLLRKVAARSSMVGLSAAPGNMLEGIASAAELIGAGSMVVDEVAETIEMPPFVEIPEASTFTLSDEVISQLRSYVAAVASMYNDNPFHNFEHASHVTMSVNKLLARIVAPQQTGEAITDTPAAAQAFVHMYTYGIASDPLLQFAVVLSALIHDLDHPGIPNGRLIQENRALAERYQERSVAEQNSVDLAWTLLMSETYTDLRGAIAGTVSELRRFRQIMVNAVIATDIFDRQLSTLRRERWQAAFYESPDLSTKEEENPQGNINRKATIVMEHLIQASDVAHTMQHWHVYQKWNQRLFDEMYGVYCEGRAEKDPSLGWYDGELWFFDNYIIPLAKKLKECGVFGVSSDEYLTYALANRSEWAEKGNMLVEQYLAEYHRKKS